MSGRADFWARRKAAVRAEQEAAQQAVETRAIEDERAVLEEKSDEEILAELDLPDPDDLQPGDDVQRFMAEIVPDRLRRRALRQLWKLNPILANVDGLVDYGEDFTDAAKVIENLQTTYQVGKGMLAHVEEMARQAEAAEAEDAELPEDDEAVVEALSVEEEVDVAAPAPADEVPHDIAAEDGQTKTQENQSDTHYAAAPRRRMRFEFEG